MNISPSLSAPKFSDQAMQLLAIMQDCGVDKIWKNQELRLLVVYLENTIGEQKDIRHDVTSSVFLYLVKKIFRSREFWELGIERHVLHWFLRFANGSHLKQALCASLIGKANASPIKAQFDSNHPAFKRDEDEFKKTSLLMMLEGFPANWDTEHSQVVNGLTCLELLYDRHGAVPALSAFSKSLERKERVILEHAKCLVNKNGDPILGKSQSTERYCNMTSINRIRFLRYYRYASVISEYH